MARKRIGETAYGQSVYLTSDSPAAANTSNNPDLLKHVKRALSHLEVTGPSYTTTHDCREVVGEATLVETTAHDQVFYAKRKGRKVFARFVRNGKTTPTTHLTLAFVRTGDGYNLQKVWPGDKTPLWPGEPDATNADKEFWLHHALVWNGQEIHEDSITTDCPW